jgi:hypothetical protein
MPSELGGSTFHRSRCALSDNTRNSGNRNGRIDVKIALLMWKHAADSGRTMPGIAGVLCVGPVFSHNEINDLQTRLRTNYARRQSVVVAPVWHRA